MTDLTGWVPRQRPKRVTLEGQYVRLEPLVSTHADTLFMAASAPGMEDRFRWLSEGPPGRVEFDGWLEKASASMDPMFFVVIDKASGRAEGRQALMRIDSSNGVVEIGNIMWGAALQRTRMATEALYLFADRVFDLGYRRFEWKCNDLNDPSKRAAKRFGFRPEGVFRQHMVGKNVNRDTAWFAMTDGDWQRMKPIYEDWLASENFNDQGQQHKPLRV